jgi:hypothetical protein
LHFSSGWRGEGEVIHVAGLADGLAADGIADGDRAGHNLGCGSNAPNGEGIRRVLTNFLPR